MYLDNFTISIWGNISSHSEMTIIGKGDYGDPNCTNYFISIYSDAICGAYEYGTGINVDVCFSTLLELNKWNHYVFGYNKSTNQLFLYINGTLVGIGYNTNLPSFNSDPMRIGGMPNTPNTFFNGKIDDIRIYNRALSETEIQQLYNE